MKLTWGFEKVVQGFELHGPSFRRMQVRALIDLVDQEGGVDEFESLRL